MCQREPGAPPPAVYARSTVGGVLGSSLPAAFQPAPTALPPPEPQPSGRPAPHWLASAKTRIEALTALRNEERADAPLPPTRRAAKRAIDWLDAVAPLAASLLLEDAPLINASEEGEVVFEWFAGPRCLTVYIDEDGASYLKSWGADMDHEMDEGDIPSAVEVQELWSWLLNGPGTTT